MSLPPVPVQNPVVDKNGKLTQGWATWFIQLLAKLVSLSGNVTSVSVVSANGFTGSVATSTSTPAITLATSVTGVLKGNGTAVSAATAGSDYSAGTAALVTGILKSTQTTGALSIAVAADFPTLNQNTSGTAANVTTNANLTGPVTSVGNATSIANGAITNAMLANTAVANLSGTNTGDQTNITGNAATVTTNANLTGPVTSTGNATSIANNAITQAMTGATATPTASKTASWDGNVNLSAVNLIEGYTTTVTSAAALALTVGSTYNQYFTGTTAGQSVKLPVASTLVLGQQYALINISTQTVSAQTSAGSGQVLQVMAANSILVATCILASGTTTASWSWTYNPVSQTSFALTNPMTTLGDLIYGGASGAPTRLAGNTTTTPQFLTSTGAASAATAPTLTGSTGSGNVVLATSPTLVTPVLGTPTSGALTNCTSIPAAQLSGTTMASNVVTSSLTGVGTIATGVWNGTQTSGYVWLTSGTTWTSPSGVTSATLFKITCWGAGGSGGGAKGTYACGSGGASGAKGTVWLTGLAASTGYTIAIGQGQTGGANTGGNGTSGGNTTISINSTTYTAQGGGAGYGNTNSSAAAVQGGGGNNCSNFTINGQGAPGGPGICVASGFPIGGFGGSTEYGSGGASPGAGAAGTNGVGIGAGGAGAASGSASTGYAGGNSSNGAILIEWQN